MRHTLSTWAFLAISHSSIQAACAQSPAVMHRISESIVKVEAGSNLASGFVWGDQAHVVTALHVVDNGGAITVKYVNRAGVITAVSSASVAAVLKDSDLVLLKLSTPQPRTPLSLAGAAPSPDAGASFNVVGFPLNIQAVSATSVRIRFGGNTLDTILPPKSLKAIGDYPSPKLAILNLEGSLVPGHSGAPIIDASGAVIGIADGGIENGAVAISFGIPASRLAALADAGSAKLPRSKKAAELFSADLDSDVGTRFAIGNLQFTKVRTRTFAQLASTADDALGLQQLTTGFQFFDPYSFRYDIYQEAASGAVVALPAGATLSDGGALLEVDTGEPQMTMKLQLAKMASSAHLQNTAAEFEKTLLEVHPAMQAYPDPQWTYLTPMVRYGVVVQRRAWVRNVINGGMPVPDKYLFETLASSGRYFLGIAAIDNDTSPEHRMKEMMCAQNGGSSGCAAIVRARSKWAQIVLGVQFSTFPQKNTE